MEKFIKEKQEEEVLLSTYLKEERQDYDEERRKQEVGYLKEILGDVGLPRSIIETLRACFHTFGGRYSVRSDEETIKGLYSFYKKYPYLSASAIDDLAFIYIEDLFETYFLKDTFEEFVKKYGKKDLAFEKFYEYVEAQAETHQKQYDETSHELISKYHLVGDYSLGYIKYLESLIKRRHIPLEKILEAMPSKEIVRKDEILLLDIMRKSSDSFSVGYPTSYIMTMYLAKKGNLDVFDERPSYSKKWEGHEVIYDGVFTKKEFLESTKKERIKRLEKK